MKSKVEIKGSIIRPNNVTFVLVKNGQPTPYNIAKGHPNFDKILEKVKKNDAKDLDVLTNVGQSVTNWGKGQVVVKNGEIYYNGEIIHNSLTRRILAMVNQGDDVSPLVNFLKNLQDNPSMTARQELYDFLEGNNLPITRDGNFLAYKRVKSNFRDLYTGTMDNSPGKVVSMDRSKVDDNRLNTCSAGLHFASLGYARDSYGTSANCGNDRMLVLEINPADVVSIPVDYNNQKGRTWKYRVVGEIKWQSILEKDYLETRPVVDSASWNAEEEAIEDFLSRKAAKQRRDSRGRFIR
jgi:hypothetical protein